MVVSRSHPVWVDGSHGGFLGAGMTQKEIERAIAGITEQMKRPLPDYERALLNAERKDLREMLVRLQELGVQK